MITSIFQLTVLIYFLKFIRKNCQNLKKREKQIQNFENKLENNESSIFIESRGIAKTLSITGNTGMLGLRTAGVGYVLAITTKLRTDFSKKKMEHFLEKKHSFKQNS